MKKETMEVLKDWAEKQEVLDVIQKETLLGMGAYFYENVDFLYQCFACMGKGEEYVADEENSLLFANGSLCSLTCKENILALEKEAMWNVLAGMVDILEKVYPLGTVVELNEEFSKSLNIELQEPRVKVVIVERFTSMQDMQTYFPYAGVVYPVGTAGSGRLLNFTSPLISNVMQAGYSNEMDEAYVILMKRELKVDHGLSSFGFLPKEQMDRYAQALGG